VRVIEDDSELAQDFDANVTREIALHRGASQKEIGFGLVDGESSELQLWHRANFGLGIAADTSPPAAMDLANHWQQCIRLNEIMPETKAAIATGIDFKPAANWWPSRKVDDRLDHRSGISELEGNDLAGTGVFIISRVVEPDHFRARINLDGKSSEEAGAENAFEAARTSLFFRRQRGHSPGEIRRASKIENNTFKNLRLFLPGDSGNGGLAGPPQFQGFREPGIDRRNGKPRIEHEPNRVGAISLSWNYEASAFQFQRKLARAIGGRGL